MITARGDLTGDGAPAPPSVQDGADEHVVPGATDDLQHLVAALRDTPFHRWHELRDQSPLEFNSYLLEAEAIVRSGWSVEDVRAHIRTALTAAATELILAMPDDLSDTEAVDEHLQQAGSALHAASQLTPTLGYRYVA